jgi:AmiR/NasT family two-component response regulator
MGVSAYLTKPIDDRELDAAIRLAAHRHGELEALEAEAARARQALADRKLVEHAKGILIDALALSEPEAFHRIQHAARQHNLRLVDVARQIIDQRDLLAPPAREDHDTR